MRNRWMMLGVLGFGGIALADAPPTAGPATEVQAAIASVTVYSDRARVTRRAEGVALGGAGKLRFTVKGLPDGLQDDSVRVSFPSIPGIRILSVEVERQFKDRFTSEEGKRREEAVKALDEEGRRLGAREAALAREADLLQTLSVGAQPNPGQQPQAKPLAPEAWSKVLDAVAQGLDANAKARLEAAQTRRSWQRRLDVARQALQETQSYHRTSEKVATVEVDAAGVVMKDLKPVTIELSYLIGGARWSPSYDVRVMPGEGQIQVARYAVIQQRTGEDWADASLVCSTAVPAVSATLPDLLAWNIGEAPRERRVLAMSADRKNAPGAPAFNLPMDTMETADSENFEYSKKMGEELKQEMKDKLQSLEKFDNRLDDEDEGAVAFATGGLPSVRGKGDANKRFHQLGGNGASWGQQVPWVPPCVLAGGYDYAFPALKTETVKSDGKPSRVALGTDGFPAALTYEAAPLASPYTFLKCDLKNTTAAPYLGGTANIFLAGDFLGSAPLKTVAVGETVPVPLGIDEKIKVTRKTHEVKGAAGFFHTKEKTDTVVEISATSFLKAPVALRILDRAPYSFSDDIQVTVEEASPKTAEEPKKGVMIWDLQLQPGQPQTATFTYGVKTPEDFDLDETPDMEGAR